VAAVWTDPHDGIVAIIPFCNLQCPFSFSTSELRTDIVAHPSNRVLFQTRRITKFTTRRIQQIVKMYTEMTGVRATPHTFRH
jgi:site-specific recombinase XerD